MWPPSFITVCNEVAKVMFLHVSVILFTGGGGCLSPHPKGKLRGIWSGGCLPIRGLSVQGVGVSAWGVSGHTPRQQTATAADGTHPTGIHSSFNTANVCKRILNVSLRCGVS